MRVLLVCNVYPPRFIGGAELIAHEQAKALKQLGHQVEVFAGETHPFGEHHEIKREVWDGIAVNRISMLPRDYEPGFVNFTHRPIERHLEDVLARFRPDIVHAHNLIGLTAIVPYLARQAGARCVVTLHDHWGYCFKNTIIKQGTTVCEDFSRCRECMPTIDDGAGRAIPIRFRKDFIALMLRYVDAFVSPSRYLADSYVKAGFPADRMHVLWNGIDVDRFKRVRRNACPELRLTYVGILAPHKGVQTLMEALGHLPPGANAVVNVVGADVGMLPAYEAILAANGRRERVRFWGRIDSAVIQEVYAETDVLVLPSIWPENQPVSITEAMSCGIPAIVSNMGGMLELVEDGVSGDVFRAADPADLARKIALYLADPARAERLGAAARARIEQHSFAKQVEKLVALYHEARRAPGTPPAAERIIGCIGHRVDEATAQAAEELGREGWRFVMREWLPEGLAAEVRAIWVADPQMTWPDAQPHAAADAPLLVDVRNAGMRKVLQSARAALFFRGPSQAGEMLRKLEANPEASRELNDRAQRLAMQP